MYSPTTARWMSRDPLGTTVGPNGEFDIFDQYYDGPNLYQYVRSQPTVAIDPSGLHGRGWQTCGSAPGWWDDARYPKYGCCNGIKYQQRGPGKQCCVNGKIIPCNPIPYDECRDEAGDWLDCMACCLGDDLDDQARQGGTLVVGQRRVKVVSLSEVSTTSPWKKEFNSLGRKCGKVLRIGAKAGTWVVTRTVAVVTIAEGGFEYKRIAECANRCAPPQ